MSTANTLPKTISLIGMPGAGKSTVGVLLAKIIGLAFRDTDLDIQLHAKATLQEILDREGYLKLRELEQEIILQIPLKNVVISTGGSVVYSAPSMQRLAAAGPIVYLQVDFDTLQTRVAKGPARGIASATQQSFAETFRERTPLYEQYADITMPLGNAGAQDVAGAVVEALAHWTRPDALTTQLPSDS